MAHVGIPMLTEKLETIVIPEISGRKHTPVGHVHYEFKKFVTKYQYLCYICNGVIFYFSIKIESFSMPTYSLTSGNSGLELKTSEISATIHGDWHYKL